jgi:tripartite-type tricarboxylate transporter receptor subunit TctC
MKVMGAILASAALALSSVGAFAQSKYPERAITLIVPFSAGGSSDATVRYIADQLQKKAGVPVLVENRPGGGATVGLAQLATATPDGYTLGLLSTSPTTVTPHFQKVPYNVATDFTMIAQYMINPAPLIVRKDSPFQTIDDLLKFGAANPGKLRWATGAPRGTNHIATEAALKARGVQATFVPFSGGAEPATALLGGNVEFLVITEFGPLLANDQVRLLAESGPNKIPGHPEVRTYKELGFPLSIPIFYGIGGPAGIPEDVVKYWEAFLKDQSQQPGFEELVAKFASVVKYSGSQEFTRTVIDGNREIGEAAKTLGLRD